MGRTSARATIFFSATFLLLYAIAVATVSFKGLNVTAFHLSQPLLIGYGVFWVIVAPSGLWGIFGSTLNNTDLCNRYLRDHWFSSALISTVDVIKIIFSFTMKDNSIQKCLASTGTSIDNCRKKADLFLKAGLIAFVAQGLLLIGLGLLTWLSCRRLMKKKGEKTKEVLKNDLETQNKHQLNDDDRVNNEIRDSAMSLERTETNLPSLFTRRPSQYSDNSNKSNRGQKGPDEQEKIKKDDNDEDIVRLHEDQEGNIRNFDNVDYIKDVNINNVKNADNINNIKNVDNINDTKNVNDINNVKNFKNMQRFNQQQHATISQRSRRSYDRQMILSDGPPPPKGMNQMAPISRSKSMAPPVRSNSNILPPLLPEYRFMQPIQYPQGIQGMRNNRVPLPPPYYYNRPPPLPQLQQMPNFRPLYPWQQQWMGFNNGPNPPQKDFRGHRRSKSHPELRPLPFPPSSNPSQIPKQRTIPSQIIEQQIPVIVDSKISKNRNKYENEIETETKNENNNNTKNASATNSRRSSTSSRYKPPLSSIIEQKRPHSQMHRTNSLPNLSKHEDLMRNEMLFAPPVPPIPSSLQSDTKNSNNKDKLNNKNTIIDNTDKFEKFIKMYGNKEYDMSSENPHYNKYSGLQQNNDKNGWNTNENDDYVPPKRKRPKSAQSVRGEASPKSSIYVDDNKDNYYNDYYYYPNYKIYSHVAWH